MKRNGGLFVYIVSISLMLIGAAIYFEGHLHIPRYYVEINFGSEGAYIGVALFLAGLSFFLMQYRENNGR